MRMMEKKHWMKRQKEGMTLVFNDQWCREAAFLASVNMPLCMLFMALNGKLMCER